MKFIEGRSWNLEQKKNSRLAYLVNVFKAGINEEIPGGSKFLIFKSTIIFKFYLFIDIYRGTDEDQVCYGRL